MIDEHPRSGPGRRPSADNPHPIDQYVGERIRWRRQQLGLSQGMLGHRVGLTFQQVQKYEHGRNRVGASRLFQLAVALDVPVSFFFDGAEQVLADHEAGLPRTMPLERRDAAELLREFNMLDQPGLRRAVVELVRQAVQTVKDAGQARSEAADEVGARRP